MSGYGLGLVVILFSFGLAGGIIGRIKGSSFTLWFLISFCVPFIGLLTAILYRYESDELRRECPRCHKVLKLEFPEVAIAPQARSVAVSGESTPSH
jgi:hypothetical protein